MPMTAIQRCALPIAIAVSLLAGCGKGDEQLAYGVCLAAAKKEPHFATAVFAAREKSTIQASTGNAAIRVNIPYDLEGKQGLYQCIADKQADGTYRVTLKK